MRTTIKYLSWVANIINANTNHRVEVCNTLGCGVYLTIDGKEYEHQRKDGTIVGIPNKEARELLEPLFEEAFYKEKQKLRLVDNRLNAILGKGDDYGFDEYDLIEK